MRIKEIKLYKYDELSDEAKEKAREWFLEGYESSFDWEYVQEDANNIGLEIMFLRPTGIQGNNEGKFKWDALEVANAIFKEHGNTCETYKTALSYLKQLQKENDENLSDEREKTERSFLYDLLEDYRIMLEKEVEYQTSKEQVEENILANEYEFTEDGKCE